MELGSKETKTASPGNFARQSTREKRVERENAIDLKSIPINIQLNTDQFICVGRVKSWKESPRKIIRNRVHIGLRKIFVLTSLSGEKRV